MVTLFVQNNIQEKNRTQNTQWKQIYRWKWYRSMTRRNVRHFPRLSAEWRRIAFVYDVIGDMTIATNVDARGDSSHRKRRVLRRLKMAMCRQNLFHYDLRVCTELQVRSKTASRLWFYAYNTKSTRTLSLQDVQSSNVK